jgi:hypothetical protein
MLIIFGHPLYYPKRIGTRFREKVQRLSHSCISDFNRHCLDGSLSDIHPPEAAFKPTHENRPGVKRFHFGRFTIHSSGLAGGHWMSAQAHAISWNF